MSTFRRSVEYILRNAKLLLSNLDDDKIEDICKEFLKARRIFLYGAGRSGLVAKAFAIRLVHLGLQAYVIGETITPPVREEDLVVVISGSGETIPSVMTADIAKRMGARLIAITSKRDSKIARRADLPVILSVDLEDKDRSKLAPLGTIFEASSWIFLDGLIARLMEMKGEDEERMKERHATLQ
ncbi:MAG TPA: 6-phospho-3-hexuloisomerase [Thermoplasmatales archaeon]|nr:6-phospho-3-hexuloisomerase [Thermoplasmatales archaeon]HEX16880.1 6-phospho-3-hexuloisomerase [Thermoplasmatales archaeon]